MTISASLARFAIETPVEAIPEKAIELGRIAIQDCVACISAGAASPAGRIAAEVASRGSSGRASIIGTPFKVRPQDAALANGTAGHALDLDDIAYTMMGHPSVAILPAALAVAEDLGLGGRALIEAYVIGVQVVARFGAFVAVDQYDRGWHTTGSIGIIGAVCAASRLLGLTVEQTTMAIGIAASSSSGLRRNFGSMTKPFHAGDAARGAVLAAELAQSGFTSVDGAIDAKYGWCDTLGDKAVPSIAEVEATLANGWEVIDPGIVLKRYAACGCTHCALEAVVGLKDAHNLKSSDIRHIIARTHPIAKKVLQYPRPVTGLQGKFSMEYAVALGLAVGHPKLGHFEDAWTRDPDVLSLIEKVTFEEDTDLSSGPNTDQGVPAHIILTLADGRVLESTIRVPSGDPRNPMTARERQEKFEDCVSGLAAVSEDDRSAAWRRFEALENERDLSGLISLLAGTAADSQYASVN